MSSEVSSDHVCYVYCNFCNTVLAVSVPRTNMFNIVTVRCGHCANLLSVNMGGLMHQTLPAVHGVQNKDRRGEELGLDCGSSSGKFNTMPLIRSSSDVEQRQPINLPIRPPEKRQRVPSAYNRFIKEEIQRIKANNPDISHREAFSAAAKNWAHFPRIHFGLDSLETNKRTKLDEVIAVAAAVAADGVQTAQGFY